MTDMKTPRDIIAQHIMWAKADWARCNHQLADKLIVDLRAAGYVIAREGDDTLSPDKAWIANEAMKALDAAGYVIRSRQANFNAARMEAALIGIASGEGEAAEEAKAALKWCEDHPA